MPVRFESPAPIDAMRAAASRSSGSSGGGRGGGGNASQIAALNQNTYEFDSQMDAAQEAPYRAEDMRQQQMSQRLEAIDRAAQAGAVDPDTANNLRLQVQTGLDPARSRLTRLQADQEELENVRLQPQEQQRMLQLSGALDRITEAQQNGSISAQQAAAQRAVITPQLAQYQSRQTQSSRLGQVVERGMMVQQANDRIIQRNPDGTMLVVNQHGVPEVQGAGRLEAFVRSYTQVAQAMRDPNAVGAAPPDHAAIMRRLQDAQRGFTELHGTPTAAAPSAPAPNGPPQVANGPQIMNGQQNGQAPPEPTPEVQVVGAREGRAVVRLNGVVEAERGSNGEITAPRIVPESIPPVQSAQLGDWLGLVDRSLNQGGRITNQTGADAQAAAYLIRTYGPRDRMTPVQRRALDIGLRRLGVIARHDDENEARPASPAGGQQSGFSRNLRSGADRLTPPLSDAWMPSGA